MITAGGSHKNAQLPGVCYVISWPSMTANDVDVYTTDDGCTITKYSVSIVNTYTTAIPFTFDNTNGSCQTIACWTSYETKYISIGKHHLYTCIHISVALTCLHIHSS